MSITVHRAMLTTAGGAVLVFAPALPASAQADSNVVLSIMVECSKIDDVSARVACYDNNIPGARGTVAPAAPQQGGIPQGSSAPAATVGVARAARVSARSPQLPAAPISEPARSTPTVAAVASLRPGAYVVTLEDGAQWEFAEDMAPSYRAPARGSRVEINRGTFGSYRMRFDGQQPVRVQRVR